MIVNRLNEDKLLEHFQDVSERYGLLPYVRLNTSANSLNVIGGSEKCFAYRPALEWFWMVFAPHLGTKVDVPGCRQFCQV